MSDVWGPTAWRSDEERERQRLIHKILSDVHGIGKEELQRQGIDALKHIDMLLRYRNMVELNKFVNFLRRPDSTNRVTLTPASD